MDLAPKQTALRNQSNLPLAERAQVSCHLAKQLEKAGEYEAAYEALNEFWPDRNEPPKLSELDDPQKAEALLRIGTIAGWLDSTDQIAGGQETAKDMITKSIGIFERLDKFTEAAEAHGDLALCYWREGSYDEARVHLRTALHLSPAGNDELKAILLIRAGMVEVDGQRLDGALRLYNEAAPLVEKSEDHALKGSFTSSTALFLDDYLPRRIEKII